MPDTTRTCATCGKPNLYTLCKSCSSKRAQQALLLGSGWYIPSCFREPHYYADKIASSQPIGGSRHASNS